MSAEDQMQHTQDPMSGQTHDLWAQFLQFAQQFNRAAAALLNAHHLTPPQFLMLMALHQHDKTQPTQQELADALLVTKGNVSQMLKVMERENLIVRQTEGGVKRIQLTKRARTLYAEVEAAHAAFVQGIFGALDEQDQVQMARMIARLQMALESGRAAHCQTDTEADTEADTEDNESC
jgi:DNA-binding MarR family transcriptional regulator